MLFWRKQKRPQKPNIDEALSHALRFTEADLKANRSGRLTEEQASQITLIDIINLEGGVVIRGATSVRAWNGVSIVLAGFSFFVILGSLTRIVTATENQDVEIGVGLMIFAAVIAQMPIYNTMHYRKCRADFQTDLKMKRVEMVEGKLFLNIPHGYRASQRLHITDIILYVPDETCFRAFKDLMPYRLYYLPQTRVVVSAEPLF